MNICVSDQTVLPFFATTPKGLELLLVEELRELGAVCPAEKLAGVTFSGDLTLAYRVCLWSRLANRVLLTLKQLPAATPEALYEGVQQIDWSAHLDPEGSLAVHFVSTQSTITHTLFGAQKVKDAIVDQMRERFQVRPNVDLVAPDISVYVYLYRDMATISLDLSGSSLHKRSYRIAATDAPIKENLAAALLLRANWPAIARDGGALMDPMCGSGTLLIEAALMAGDIAPGLFRDYFGFLGWKQHDSGVWEKMLAEARLRADAGVLSLPTIIGYDHDAAAIHAAFKNIESAGLTGKIHVEKRDITSFEPKQDEKPGLVIVNPPYGERLGELASLAPLYTSLGEQLKTKFEGWQAAVLTASPDLGKKMGLRAKRYYALFNGALPCQLLLFDVQSPYFVDRSPQAENERRIRVAKRLVTEASQQAAQMFENRLKKNVKHFARVAERKALTSYQVYDADIPEYAFNIHMSDGTAYIKEYSPPAQLETARLMQKRYAVLAILPDLLNLPATHIYFNTEKSE